MHPRIKKFLSYYKPDLGLFLTLMICALVVAGISLLYPLLVRYIVKNILERNTPDAFWQIYRACASCSFCWLPR
jgi:ATP-binding cassette subfamily B protein